MSNCDACVGVEAEHHLCDECVQDDIEATRALRAERDAALALADATQAELAAERERHHATATEATRRHEFQTDWYAQRFTALRKWVTEEVRPVSPEAYNRYFSIVANGSPAPHESIDWSETLHAMKIRAEQAEARHHATASELNKAVAWLDRCAWARSVIDLDAGPLEVQLVEALGRVERLTAALSHLLGVGHSLKAFAGTMLRWREQPGVDFSDEAARIVRLAEENHQTIKAALLKETP